MHDGVPVLNVLNDVANEPLCVFRCGVHGDKPENCTCGSHVCGKGHRPLRLRHPAYQDIDLLENGSPTEVRMIGLGKVV